MCEWCGLASDAPGRFGIVEQPAQILSGRFWRGTHAEAAAGATRAMLRDIRRMALETSGGSLWAGPLVGLSWAVDVENFRYFAGFEHSGDGLRDVEQIGLPAMRFVADWHAEADGDVLDHYQRMLRWMEADGEKWDKSRLHHREEYPLHGDLHGPPALRLMLPVG